MQHGERGVSIVLVAVLIVVFFIFAALAVDIGVLYTARTSTQHIADAAALAGAYTFTDSGLTPSKQPDAATNAALAMGKDKSGNPVTILGKDVTLTVVDVTTSATQQSITVKASAVSPVFFAKAFWPTDNLGINATATAEAATVAGGTGCLKPFWILNSNGKYDKDGNCTQPLISGGVPTNNWTLPIDLVLYGPSSPSNYELVNPNSFDGTMAGSCSGTGGAITVEDSIGGCFEASCGTNMRMCKDNGGKVSHITDRVLDVTGNPPDTFVGLGQYKNAAGVISNTSPSLVSAVIWDDCGKCKPEPGYSGFPVAGFGKVFITTNTAKLIEGKLVGYNSCGPDNSGSGGSGPYAVPIRLVHR
jgi:Flp pilus assembly protein TadG